jgi:hypothetical protein
MKRRYSFPRSRVPDKLARVVVVLLFVCFGVADVAFADGTGSLETFTGPLRNGLNLIMVFGFIAGPGKLAPTLPLPVAPGASLEHMQGRSKVAKRADQRPDCAFGGGSSQRALPDF